MEERKEEEDRYPLHRCVFQGDVKALSSLIGRNDINLRDKQGNTPLHLAVMLGRKECIMLLLAHGALVKMKNSAGWTPLAEAISYGDRDTISCLLWKLKQQTRERIEQSRLLLMARLLEMGDFYMELKWDFTSWVPLFAKVLPSDVCRIHKRGTSVRVDTTLLDFKDMRCERGDISCIFNSDQEPSKSVIVMDNIGKMYQILRNKGTDIEDEVDILMSSDITVTQMSTKNITFTRAQSGWLFLEDKKDMVGPFHADYYHIHGMALDSKKRREHLTEEDMQRNKAIRESLTRGSSDGFINGEQLRRRPSLHPPPESNISWEEYISAPAGQCPLLGRQLIYKESRKMVRATVAMSPDFPMTIDMLLNLLEVMGSFKHFNKLKKFVLMKLPPGFPVELDIPLVAAITARVTFQKFEFRNNIDPELFRIPPDYVEDPNRFPEF